MKSHVNQISIIAVAIGLGLVTTTRAGEVNDGDWKSGGFTDWNVDASQNNSQKRGVGSFSFPKASAEGPNDPPPCAAQGGVGNCAAFFGVGGPCVFPGGGPGASVFISQTGGPPPMGNSLLFLEAGTQYTFTAQLASQAIGSVPDPDGGRVIVRIRPAGAPVDPNSCGPRPGETIAQFMFGPVNPGETRFENLTGSFVPMESRDYTLEIEFRREQPFQENQTPFIWIDNIVLDSSTPPGGATVPADSTFAMAGLIAIMLAIGYAGIAGRRQSAAQPVRVRSSRIR